MPPKPVTNFGTFTQQLRGGRQFRPQDLARAFTNIQQTIDRLGAITQDQTDVRSIVNEFVPVSNVVYAHRMTGADIGAKINAAVNSLPAVGGLVLIQSDDYRFETPIKVIDRQNITICGFGPSTRLVPTNMTGHTIDLSGSTNIVICDLTIDGVNRLYGGHVGIFGDGTTANPIYGRIRIDRCFFLNYPNINISLSATAGNTCRGVEIVNNFFDNPSGTTNNPQDVITAPGAGSKQYFTISGNVINFSNANPPPFGTTGGRGIIASHGSILGCTITGNVINQSFAEGISIFARPTVGEATLADTIVIANNTIILPRYAGISIFGGKSINVTGNSIQAPGTSTETDDKRAGILLTHGISLAADVAQTDIHVVNNQIAGSSPDTNVGVFDFHSAGNGGAGTIAYNPISGTLAGNRIEVTPDHADKWLIIDSPTDGMVIGGRDAGAGGVLSLDGTQPSADCFVEANQDIQAMDDENQIFMRLNAMSAKTAASFRPGLGMNLRWDNAGALWRSGFDGTNNGFAAMLLDYSNGDIEIANKDSTGGTSQTATAAALALLVRMIIKPGRVQLQDIPLAVFDTTLSIDRARIGTGSVRLWDAANVLRAEIEDDGAFTSLTSTAVRRARMKNSGTANGIVEVIGTLTVQLDSALGVVIDSNQVLTSRQAAVTKVTASVPGSVSGTAASPDFDASDATLVNDNKSAINSLITVVSACKTAINDINDRLNTNGHGAIAGT